MTLPLVAPGIAGAALLAFSLSFDDFIITNFISGNVNTFPKFVYVSAQRGIPAQAYVVGSFMFLLAMTIVLLVEAVPLAPVEEGLTGVSTHPLAGVRGVPLWLDSPARPEAREPQSADLTVDLAIVGGGFTGLWTALLAAEADPGRSIVLVEAGTLGWAASGRNGGFCSTSLTHGLANGLERWPDELPTLLRLGEQNFDELEATLERHGIDCDLSRGGDLTVAVADWQLEDLAEVHEAALKLGQPSELLDAGQTRALAGSPTYLGGLRDPRGTAVLDPARLVWGLAAAAESLGVTIHEGTRVLRVRDEADRVRLDTRATLADGGSQAFSLRARRVVLGTNAFPSPLRRLRPFVVPVWDHVLATEPLTDRQWDDLGWTGGYGISDAGNQFHYYRTTGDRRIVWGGYDALYYYGSDLSPRRIRREATERALWPGTFSRPFRNCAGSVSVTPGPAQSTPVPGSPPSGVAAAGANSLPCRDIPGSVWGVEIRRPGRPRSGRRRAERADRAGHGPPSAGAVPAGTVALGRNHPDPAESGSRRRRPTAAVTSGCAPSTGSASASTADRKVVAGPLARVLHSAVLGRRASVSSEGSGGPTGPTRASNTHADRMMAVVSFNLSGPAIVGSISFSPITMLQALCRSICSSMIKSTCDWGEGTGEFLRLESARVASSGTLRGRPSMAATVRAERICRRVQGAAPCGSTPAAPAPGPG